MRIPYPVQDILKRLGDHGYTAYIVGGCVRDSLLGCKPTDWDIATSAKPDQIKCCFSDCIVLETGIQHGTVTVLVEQTPYEITTFRADGTYTDGRHPDQVIFVDELYADLARRDFTVNAMAYHPQRGLVDAFNGIQHLKEKKIVCVGDPEQRFQEDALRILRAVRFASTLEFVIDPQTASAMHKLRALLCCVSAERLTQELSKLLCGCGCAAVLLDHRAILLQILPELAVISWETAVRCLSVLPPDFALRLAALLCFCPGNAADRERLTQDVLARLRCSRSTERRILLLTGYAPEPLPTEIAALKWRLNCLNAEVVWQVILVRRALLLALGESLASLEQTEDLLEQILTEKQCYRLCDLAVNGKDLAALGLPAGKAIGEGLQLLLRDVIEGVLPNEHDQLCRQVQKIKENFKCPD